ncbi:MAG: hypothetical protein KIT10_06795 [Flavobacteriales bacterium]|nr:hypothetical protein [Flavobacteriales bacterium]
MERDIHAPDAQGFIPGVYNYCDRLCERCRFVRQCRVGIAEMDDVGTPDAPIGGGAAEDLRKRLEELMGLTPEDVERDAGKEDDADDAEGLGSDFDPADLEPDPAWEKRMEEKRRQTDAHPLSHRSHTYMELVHEWLEAHAEEFKRKGLDMYKRPEITLPVGAHTPEMIVLREAIHEIGWFHTMLHVKCRRAVQGKLEDGDWDDDPHQSDWNGTAKLALHIVDRCQVAWDMVAEMMPEEAGEADTSRELLKRIGEGLKQEFPDADRFIRAGFDAPRQP